MSIEEKILALQEAAKKIEADKADDAEDKLDGGDDEAIEGEDETKPNSRKQDVKEEVKVEESVKVIDLGALFDGVDLTEEFKEKATTIFEAAVAARTEQLRESMEEELAQFAFNESVATKEGLVEKVDGYLDFVVEQWLKNNAVALDRGIKAEIFESFVGKMKNVFVEHNINLPDEEFDLVESSIHKAEELEVQLDEQVAQNVELLKTIKAYAKQQKIDECSKGMTDIDAEKFALLAEEISFEDEVSFVAKLTTIRENYVSKPVAEQTKQLTEDVTAESHTPVETIAEEVKVDPTMASYLKTFR